MSMVNAERESERGRMDVLRNRCDRCPLPPLLKDSCCCDRTRLRVTDGQCWSAHIHHTDFIQRLSLRKPVLVEATLCHSNSTFMFRELSELKSF